MTTDMRFYFEISRYLDRCTNICYESRRVQGIRCIRARVSSRLSLLALGCVIPDLYCCLVASLVRRNDTKESQEATLIRRCL